MKGAWRMRFGLARMCSLMLWFSVAMLALPLALLIAAAFGARVLLVPASLLLLIYGWVWTRFRPTAFVVHPDALEVIWPLKRRRIPRAEISAVRLIDGDELRRQVGRSVRVGAGGLWGGFGWLWTARRGILQMYVSRLDRFVWIERGRERPWLITPDRPERFVGALTR